MSVQRKHHGVGEETWALRGTDGGPGFGSSSCVALGGRTSSFLACSFT